MNGQPKCPQCKGHGTRYIGFDEVLCECVNDGPEFPDGPEFEGWEERSGEPNFQNLGFEIHPEWRPYQVHRDWMEGGFSVEAIFLQDGKLLAGIINLAMTTSYGRADRSLLPHTCQFMIDHGLQSLEELSNTCLRRAFEAIRKGHEKMYGAVHPWIAETTVESDRRQRGRKIVIIRTWPEKVC